MGGEWNEPINRELGPDLSDKEEIWAEHVVRNLDPFRKLLDIAAQSNGDIVNYANIARMGLWYFAKSLHFLNPKLTIPLIKIAHMTILAGLFKTEYFKT